MNIAIVDDDVHFSNMFNTLIQDYLPKIFSSYKVTIISDNFFSILSDSHFDIIFLDIDLNNLTGIGIASFLKNNKNNNPLIIFVSSKNELVFDALSVQPFHFIRKSNLLEDTYLIFNLLNNYYKNNKSLITINFHGRKTSIKINNIIYLESEGHNTNIITLDNVFSYRCTMKKLLEEINSNAFIQIQKSITINFIFVEEIDKDNNIILRNGNIFSISRHFKHDVLIKYKDYLLS